MFCLFLAENRKDSGYVLLFFYLLEDQVAKNYGKQLIQNLENKSNEVARNKLITSVIGTLYPKLHVL